MKGPSSQSQHTEASLYSFRGVFSSVKASFRRKKYAFKIKLYFIVMYLCNDVIIYNYSSILFTTLKSENSNYINQIPSAECK